MQLCYRVDGETGIVFLLYHIPVGYIAGMCPIERERQKLVARIRRIRGQVDAIERSLSSGDDCADVLMLLAEGFHRQPFIDLAVVFAPMSLVGSLMFARLMERDL